MSFSNVPFDRSTLPTLSGELSSDPSVLAQFSTDAGNALRKLPSAVLRPASAADVQKILRYCRTHSVQVAARGQGHTTYGQSLNEGGVIIDMSTLAEVYSIGARAVVGAGAKWSTVTARALAEGLVPPVLTSYLGLSLGGTLSVGGISSAHSAGAQIDRVTGLEIVTGEGELVWCSETQERALFEAALAGLGQFGIITRVELELVPVPSLVRVYSISYAEVGEFLVDMRRLLDVAEFSEVYGSFLCDEVGRWTHTLLVVALHEPSRAPDDDALLGRVSPGASVATPVDVPYAHYVFRGDAVIDAHRSAGSWDGVQHPWLDVFIPDEVLDRNIHEVIASLGPEDIGASGFFILYPQRRSRLTRPMLRVPESSHDWIYLLDLLTAAPPSASPDFQIRMLERNNRLFRGIHASGGIRYPIGSLDFSAEDWKLHYSERWPEVQMLKRKYDPDTILGPGLGIFR